MKRSQCSRSYADKHLGWCITLFCLVLLTISWGKVILRLSPVVILSIGGSVLGLILPVFIICAVALFGLNRSFWRPSHALPLFVFCLYALVSVLWTRGPDPLYFIDVLLPALMGYLLVRGFMKADRSFWEERLFPVFAVMPILIVLRGLVDTPGHLLAFGELDTPQEQHTLLAMILLFTIPLVFGRMLTDKRRHFYYAVCLGLMIMSVVICGSRVGLVTLFLVLLYCMFRFAGRMIRIAGAIAVVLGIAGLFAFPVTHQRFVGLLSLGNDPYMITRTRIWDMTLSFVRERLLFGTGYSRMTFLSVGQERFGEVLFFYDHPHNMYLQILALLGLVGCCLFIWLVIDTVRKIIRMERFGGEAASVFAMAFAGGCAALLFCDLAESMLNSSRLMLSFFIMMAVLDSLYDSSFMKSAAESSGAERISEGGGSDDAAAENSGESITEAAAEHSNDSESHPGDSQKGH